MIPIFAAPDQEDMIKLFDKFQRNHGVFEALASGFRNGAAPSKLSILPAFGSNPGELIARLYLPPSLADGAELPTRAG